MTFSIVARCGYTGQLGVAAITATPAVGQLLTWAQRGTGAVASQSWVNPYLGIDSLALLRSGHPADKVLQAVIAMDDGRDLRQVGLVDAHGKTAAWTGSDCASWAGHLEGDAWVVLGNILDNGETLRAAAEEFELWGDHSLDQRLMAALEAGERAGGDRRGARSATVYVVSTEEYPLWDIRVDDHEKPLEELRRLHDLVGDQLLPQILMLPTRQDALGQLSTESQRGLA